MAIPVFAPVTPFRPSYLRCVGVAAGTPRRAGRSCGHWACGHV